MSAPRRRRCPPGRETTWRRAPSASIAPLVISSSSSSGRRPCRCSIRPASASSGPARPRVGAYWNAVDSAEAANSSKRAATCSRGNVAGSGEPARERDQARHTEEPEDECDPLVAPAPRPVGNERAPPSELRRQGQAAIVDRAGRTGMLHRMQARTRARLAAAGLMLGAATCGILSGSASEASGPATTSALHTIPGCATAADPGPGARGEAEERLRLRGREEGRHDRGPDDRRLARAGRLVPPDRPADPGHRLPRPAVSGQARAHVVAGNRDRPPALGKGSTRSTTRPTVTSPRCARALAFAATCTSSS